MTGGEGKMYQRGGKFFVRAVSRKPIGNRQLASLEVTFFIISWQPVV